MSRRPRRAGRIPPLRSSADKLTVPTGLPWRQLAGLLERLKAVRYTSEGRTVVQATAIAPELTGILDKLDIAAPKTILAIG